jgi:hypothetical protein
VFADLSPSDVDLVLAFFAADAEAEVKSESEALDHETAFLVGRAGVLASAVSSTLPRGHSAARYAHVAVGWAGMKLLTRDYWRFGAALVDFALQDESGRLDSDQRSALVSAREDGRKFASGGDLLGTRDGVLEYAGGRLSLHRDEGGEDDWPLLTIGYRVNDRIADELAALSLVRRSLKAMPGQPFGKLVLTGDGVLSFRLELLEDPAHALTPDGVRRVCWVVVREGLRFEEDLGSSPTRRDR